MRILVLAQKGDWTACESALKALERSAMDEGGPKHPLAGISDNVRRFFWFRMFCFELERILVDALVAFVVEQYSPDPD